MSGVIFVITKYTLTFLALTIGPDFKSWVEFYSSTRTTELEENRSDGSIFLYVKDILNFTLIYTD